MADDKLTEQYIDAVRALDRAELAVMDARAQRDAAMLAANEAGLTYVEIAKLTPARGKGKEHLGMTPKTIAACLRRARERRDSVH